MTVYKEKVIIQIILSTVVIVSPLSLFLDLFEITSIILLDQILIGIILWIEIIKQK